MTFESRFARLLRLPRLSPVHEEKYFVHSQNMLYSKLKDWSGQQIFIVLFDVLYYIDVPSRRLPTTIVLVVLFLSTLIFPPRKLFDKLNVFTRNIPFLVSMVATFTAMYPFGWFALVVTILFLADSRLDPTILGFQWIIAHISVLVVRVADGWTNEDWLFLFTAIITNTTVIFSSWIEEANKRSTFELQEKIGEEQLQLEKEQKLIHHMLGSALPSNVASLLLENPNKPVYDVYNHVALLQSDVVGFTEWCSTNTPTTVVNYLSELFVAFDEVTLQHGVEKVKTVGDAYVSYCHLYKEPFANAVAIVSTALKMLQALEDVNHDKKESLGIRIGCHTGNVKGSLFGTIRFLYDLWGDDMNKVEVLEQTGSVNKVHVSTQLYQLIKKSRNSQQFMFFRNRPDNDEQTGGTFFVEESTVALGTPATSLLSPDPFSSEKSFEQSKYQSKRLVSHLAGRARVHKSRDNPAPPDTSEIVLEVTPEEEKIEVKVKHKFVPYFEDPDIEQAYLQSAANNTQKMELLRIHMVNQGIAAILMALLAVYFHRDNVFAMVAVGLFGLSSAMCFVFCLPVRLWNVRFRLYLATALVLCLLGCLCVGIGNIKHSVWTVEEGLHPQQDNCFYCAISVILFLVPVTNLWSTAFDLPQPFLIATACVLAAAQLLLSLGSLTWWYWDLRTDVPWRIPLAVFIINAGGGFALGAVVRNGSSLKSDRAERDLFALTREIVQARDSTHREVETANTLMNLLVPMDVARRIRLGVSPIIDSTAECSVMFVKVDTTAFPVGNNYLSNCFKTMEDELLSGAYPGLEKIKTTGPTLMLTAGLPLDNVHHAVVMTSYAVQLLKLNLPISIGIHCGPVVAGFLGLTRFCYDVFGSTVNTSARLMAKNPTWDRSNTSYEGLNGAHMSGHFVDVLHEQRRHLQQSSDKRSSLQQEPRQTTTSNTSDVVLYNEDTVTDEMLSLNFDIKYVSEPVEMKGVQHMSTALLFVPETTKQCESTEFCYPSPK